MKNCPSLSECVWVCAYVRPSGCRSTVITSAGGPASPLPTPSPLPPTPLLHRNGKQVSDPGLGTELN